jgi:hypothetical protein
MLQPTPTGGTTTGPLSFAFSGGVRVTYQRIDFTVDSAGRLTGTGAGVGYYLPPGSDVGISNLVAMSLTGFHDDPVSAAFSFAPPNARMWRYSDTYTLVLTEVVDFAGNAPASGNTMTFTTVAPPPLAAQDGFESVTGATFAGAQVLSGAGAQVIGGGQSLYVPPVASMTPIAGGTQQFAFRVALAPGDTVVRFSYRTVKPVAFGAATSVPATYLMASEGRQIVSLAPTLTETPTTTQTIAPTGDVLLGPVGTLELGLSTDATGEITLARVVPAAGGLPPRPVVVPGIIIDDLRAE